jgi:triacylglycerol lipase
LLGETCEAAPIVLTAIAIALAVAILIIALVALRPWRKPAAVVKPALEVETTLEGVVPLPAPLSGGIGRGPPLPVVLVHGLFGFDRIGIPGARFEYFRGIARHLETLGCHAHAVRLPAASSVPDRARELVAAIDALPHPRIDLIAHSLGGLDARYALSHLGLASRVRALVTVGTPHRGTPLADLALRGPLDWLRRLLNAAGIPLEAIEWLGTAALADFNARVPDAPGVRYACVVGGMHRDDSFVPFALTPAHAYLRRISGRNDGLVPIASQYWGETLAEIEADHFAQIGWRVAIRNTFDAPGLYAFIVSRLGDAPVEQASSRERRLA